VREGLWGESHEKPPRGPKKMPVGKRRGWLSADLNTAGSPGRTKDIKVIQNNGGAKLGGRGGKKIEDGNRSCRRG